MRSQQAMPRDSAVRTVLLAAAGCGRLGPGEDALIGMLRP